MSKPSIPRHADLRKYVAAGARIAGTVPLAALERLQGVLASMDGDVTLELQCGMDDEGYRVVSGTVRAGLGLQCQRCLGSLCHQVDASLALALVWREEEIVSVPSRLDGLVVGMDPYDLYELIEEELLLALPLVARHPEGVCEISSEFVVADDEPAQDERAGSPFAELAGIRRGDS